ncbi:MAG: FAD-dependent oxidoreductase [Desulfobacterales bacterium]|nr:FAD-dependent oxidoreductase [Desulfobacterales bacterium]MDD4071897.1 FAD-dependent oxidoreductase [Desulfobacterales bacterium]MDD4392506.1 FAD-dependent oxidoreductase [Desulfobacterales bacterium]
MTNARLMELNGAPGDFTARIFQHPGFVDPSRCTGCGDCTRVCPVKIPNEFDEGLSLQTAISRRYAQAVPEVMSITRRGTAPCKAACPAHVNLQGMIDLIREGRYRQALILFKQDHPFPGICGRVCHHPCEQNCSRRQVDQPLSIKAFHRFLSDFDADRPDPYVPEVSEKKNDRLAVIGSGATGLSAAYFLALKGYAVTVFERRDKAGGMMTDADAGGSFPQAVVQREIAVIEKMGVTILTGIDVGQDMTLDAVKQAGFKAVFLATGGGRQPGQKRMDAVLPAGVHDEPEPGRNGMPWLFTEGASGNHRSIVEAVAAGKSAAGRIERYLNDGDSNWNPPENLDPARPDTVGVRVLNRIPLYRHPGRASGGCIDEREDMAALKINARKEAGRCLQCGICGECQECVNVCGAGAIDLSARAVEKTIEVGAVIVASGAELFDPAGLDEFYLYRRNPNVLTSLEFERILSPEGPTRGQLLRPWDRIRPGKIAWLQCVGSRSTRQGLNSYCSTVCCMSAINQAASARKNGKNSPECTVFYRDIRTTGRDGEAYFLKAGEDRKIRFVRSAIHTLVEVPGTRDLRCRYVNDSGDIVEEIFQMVVLSVGIGASESGQQMLHQAGVRLSSHGFAATDSFRPVATSRPGVYACGTVKGPADISQAVTEAGAAVCMIKMDLLTADRAAPEAESVLPVREDSCGPARIGVFVCSCGTNIGGIIDVNRLKDYAGSLRHVAHAACHMFACSQNAARQMKESIRRYQLNRVVIAGCSPKTHEPVFRELLVECGLNPFQLEWANIRNHCTWVHADDRPGAWEKSKTLVRMAVARAALLKPLQEKIIPVCSRALIVGAGVAGLNAALCLGDLGIAVDLIERQPQAGGMAAMVYQTIEGKQVRSWLNELTDRVCRHGNIRLMTETQLTGWDGFVGNFTVTMQSDRDHEIHTGEYGAVILATGAGQYQPDEFGYGTDSRIVTQIELEQLLGQATAGSWGRVVMIQCVGSRNKKNNRCSRICCQNAIKNALIIKRQHPAAHVHILYRDIRTCGVMEDYYTEARQLGIRFIRYEADFSPEVKLAGSRIDISVYDPVIQETIDLQADLLVLSAATVSQDIQPLQRLMKLSRYPDGFVMAADSRLQPVQLSQEGVFACGSALGPCLMTESIGQAQAAASKAAALLSGSWIRGAAVTAIVDERRCCRCLNCVRICPSHAARYDGVEKKIRIEPALCRGCGICVGACPAKAIMLNNCESSLMMSQVDALMENG